MLCQELGHAAKLLKCFALIWRKPSSIHKAAMGKWLQVRYKFDTENQRGNSW